MNGATLPHLDAYVSGVLESLNELTQMYSICSVLVSGGQKATYELENHTKNDDFQRDLIERVLSSGRLRVIRGSTTDPTASSSICAPVNLPDGSLVGAISANRRGASSVALQADVASIRLAASMLGQGMALASQPRTTSESMEFDGPRVAVHCGDVVVLARPGSVRVESIEGVGIEPGVPSLSKTRAGTSLDDALEGLECQLLRDALETSGGNRAAAARALGISERRMGLRVLKYGL